MATMTEAQARRRGARIEARKTTAERLYGRLREVEEKVNGFIGAAADDLEEHEQSVARAREEFSRLVKAEIATLHKELRKEFGEQLTSKAQDERMGLAARIECGRERTKAREWYRGLGFRGRLWLLLTGR